MSFRAAKRVLFIGETINDVYHRGPSIGRSAKEPIPCIQYQESEMWAGGVVATAAHARDFCKQVDVHSTVMLSKDRYVELPHNRKLLEVYGRPITVETPLPDLSQYDVVVVNDYGHGMFTTSLRDKIQSTAPFLALNVQVNAGNYGFNTLRRWDTADYVVCNELEARLATERQTDPIIEVLRDLGECYRHAVVTRGIKGAMSIKDRELFSAGAFNASPVDTMGAGDAFLAVTAVLEQRTEPAALLRIGNAAAAVQCQTVGHREPVTRKAIKAILEG